MRMVITIVMMLMIMMMLIWSASSQNAMQYNYDVAYQVKCTKYDDDDGGDDDVHQVERGQVRHRGVVRVRRSHRDSGEAQATAGKTIP